MLTLTRRGLNVSLTLRLPAFSLASLLETPAPLLRPALATPAAPSSSPTPVGLGAALWDGLLRAVPKKKVSHSRKSMRAANKGLKDRQDLVHCQGCGRPKLHHHICGFCYGDISRRQKAAARQQTQSSPAAEAAEA